MDYYEQYANDLMNALQDEDVQGLITSLGYKDKLLFLLKENLTPEEIEEAYKAIYTELTEEQVNDLDKRLSHKFSTVAEELQQYVLDEFTKEEIA